MKALTVRQVAVELALNWGTVLRLIHRGELEAFRIGNGPKARFRIEPDALDRYKQASRVPPSGRRPEVASHLPVHDETFR